MSRASASVFHTIRSLAGLYKADGRTDGELLTLYAATTDDAVFATLMARHGAAVWCICSSILDQVEDMEEAFQSTFLALAQRAGKIHVTDTLAGWLHLVARRMALNARRTLRAQKNLHQKLSAKSMYAVGDESLPPEACEALHEEIAKLSEALRATVVLYYLEGKTGPEIAEILSVTGAAVHQRLLRARSVLEKQLTERGVTFSVAGVGAILAGTSARAALPSSLVAKTLQAATALRDGTLTGRLAELAAEALKHAPAGAPWWKTGWMVTVLCLGGLGLGMGGVAWRSGLFQATDDGRQAATSPEATKAARKEGAKPPKVDLYGDPLPSGAIARFGALRFRMAWREARGKSSLAFTPDGKTIVSCMNSACAWDAVTGKLLRKLDCRIDAGAISKDGRVLAAGCGDDLFLWDVKTGKLLRGIKTADPILGAVAVSPNGEVAAVNGGRRMRITSWDAAGAPKWNNELLGVRSLAYSSDGKTLLGHDNSTFYLWNAATGTVVRKWSQNKRSFIMGFACSPDDRLAAIKYWSDRDGGQAGRDVFIGIFELATGKELQRLVEGELNETIPLFSQDSKMVVTVRGSAPVVVCFLNVATGKEVRRIEPAIPWSDANRWTMALAPDGKTLAAKVFHTDPSIHLWDVESGKERMAKLGGHGAAIRSLAFTEDGGEVVSAGEDDVFFKWDAATGKEKYRFGALQQGRRQPGISYTCLSAGARMAAVVDVDGKAEPGSLPDTLVRVLDCKDGRQGKELYRFPGAPFVYFGAFSPNGKWLASVSGPPKHAKVRELATGKELNFSNVAGEWVWKAVFSPNGEIVAVNGWEENSGSFVVLCDMKTGGREKFIVAGPGAGTGDIQSIVFAPDGRTLAVGMGGHSPLVRPGEIQLWPLLRKANGSWYAGAWCLKIPTSVPPQAPLLFSPDAKTLAAVDGGKISLWETASGRERAVFEGHEGEVTALGYASDGRRLASGSTDATVLVWDVTGRLENGRLAAAALSEREIESLWQDLAKADAPRAGRAIWTLISCGSPAVDFCAERLSPIAKGVSAEAVAKLIADLKSDVFKVRKQAQQKLATSGTAAAPYLRQAMKTTSSAETRRMLQQFLEAIDAARAADRANGLSAGDELRGVRAIEVLEQIGTPRAQKLLSTLASGTKGFRMTDEAQRALDRLQKAHRAKN